ncbi:vitellogenin-like [Glandiceps talaboti]
MITVRPYDIDLTVQWNGHKHRFFAEMDDHRYNGAVCGLLGDADGNSRNDFMMRDGRFTKDVIEFGESWRIPGLSC